MTLRTTLIDAKRLCSLKDAVAVVFGELINNCNSVHGCRRSTYLKGVSNGAIKRIGIGDEEDANEQEDAIEKSKMRSNGLDALNTRASRTHQLELLLTGGGSIGLDTGIAGCLVGSELFGGVELSHPVSYVMCTTR